MIMISYTDGVQNSCGLELGTFIPFTPSPSPHPLSIYLLIYVSIHLCLSLVPSRPLVSVRPSCFCCSAKILVNANHDCRVLYGVGVDFPVSRAKEIVRDGSIAVRKANGALVIIFIRYSQRIARLINV